MRTLSGLSAALAWWLFFHGGASAQLEQGDVRLWIDTDVLSVDWVKSTEKGLPDARSTVIAIGPNQLGASRLSLPRAPLGVGLGYALRSKLLLDLRVGFGMDIVAGDGPDTPTFVAWSLMPGISYVPFGERTKLFLKFSPLLEFVQEKVGDQRRRLFGGCFSLGAGTFTFLNEHVSADLGLFFEGHFPDLDRKPEGTKLELADLRWVLRFGLSLWR